MPVFPCDQHHQVINDLMEVLHLYYIGLQPKSVIAIDHENIAEVKHLTKQMAQDYATVILAHLN